MKLTRRAFVAGTTAALVARPAILKAAEPLNVGYVPGNSVHWIQSVCIEKGFYKEVGFEAQVQVMQNSPQSIQQAITGAYQVATSQPEPFVAAVMRGADKLGALSAPMNRADWLLNGKQGITKLSELKGKVIGVSSLRTSEVWLTTLLLEKHGLKKGEFDFIPAGVSPLKVTALLRGSIDAAVLFRPSADLATSQGLSVLASYEALRAYPAIIYVLNKDWAAKGEAGKRVAQAITKGHKWMWDPNNKAESLAVLSKFTKQPVSLLEAVYADYFVKQKIYSKDGVLDLAGLGNALADMAADGAVFTAAPPASKFVLSRDLGGMFV
ncbi:MAG: ABC transporter substrate-binding protein [Rhizobiales bacterium]|nr:ABC transporter substrate-binding protein [Hyphomicrobiales bacterium]